MAETLTTWMQSLIGPDRPYKNPAAFAAALGMTQTTWKRGFEGGAYKTENLFKLAKVTGESPIRILRLADRGALANAIEGAFGPPRERESPAVERLLEAVRRVKQPERDELADHLRGQVELVHRALEAGQTSAPTAVTLPAVPPAVKEGSRKRIGRSPGFRRRAG